MRAPQAARGGERLDCEGFCFCETLFRSAAGASNILVGYDKPEAYRYLQSDTILISHSALK